MIKKDTPITHLSGLDINPTNQEEKQFTGLYIAQLSTSEINELDTSIVRSGGLVYDTTDNKLKLYKNGNWVALVTE